jgi:hypothetical protein
MEPSLKGLSIVVFGCAWGCGGRTDPSDAETPELPASYVELGGCPRPQYVPAGQAFIGVVHADSYSPKIGDQQRPNVLITPSPCDAAGDLVPAVWLEVPAYFLDVDEVSIECQASCVTAGMCEALSYERDASLSASLSRSQAAALCAARGGRLPSFAELARAATGGQLSNGQAELYNRWLRCGDAGGAAFDAEGCAELRGNVPDFAVADGFDQKPQRWYSDDIGPFGHFDLFGGLVERTSTQIAEPAELPSSWCSLGGEADPKTFGSGNHLGFQPAVQLEGSTFISSPEQLHFVPGAPFQDEFDVLGGADQFFGARCAYEPETQDD